MNNTMAIVAFKFEWNGDVVSGSDARSYFETLIRSPKQFLD